MKKQILLFLFSYGFCSAQVFSENFNGGILPSGWTVDNPSTTFNWEVGAQSGFASFPDGAAFFDDDAAGSASVNSSARLVSPVINLTSVASPQLSFKYANMVYAVDSSIKVEVYNGTAWVQVFSYTGDAGVWGIDWNTFMYTITSYDTASAIDLSPYANANFQMRFVYDDAGDYSYGAVIDDISITSAALATTETSASESLMMYPNPVKDNLYIKNNGKTYDKVSIVDRSGKIVKVYEGKSESYNVSDLPKGLYIIYMTGDKGIIKKKILKD
ncbi:T9SS type A sorting domain-containing protein [Chryseobacterium sp.]|uniref:T9SS-dependent choice-of-anchor J family protein n=1 Tax=Chryseobacterium sp. TaxID=1871047 RepID=UPI0025BCB24D|nr:T9SS type A sorting domain-containing protein [Chryseobacterium sp.]